MIYQIQAKYLKNAIKFIIFKGKKEPEHISHSNSFQRQPTNPYGILALYSPPVPKAFYHSFFVPQPITTSPSYNTTDCPFVMALIGSSKDTLTSPFSSTFATPSVNG